ncbi:hypothetical protein [Streptomyces sp. JW3]|uniref:hypothetical protein n=1 Tax=Streptomyces sp. JW3 TaxID=3456955 RepID=UPI003FA4331D
MASATAEVIAGLIDSPGVRRSAAGPRRGGDGRRAGPPRPRPPGPASTRAREHPGPRAPGPAAVTPPRPGAGLRALARTTGAAAAVLYLWGLLGLGLAVLTADDSGADSAPLLPCRTPGLEARWERVVDYAVSFLPLRFRCVTTDGADCTTDAVPGYVNPGVTALALACGAGAVAARAAGRRD